MTEVNREYKDRVFKFIFGNPENKEWTLSLYNAVNGSQHSNPDDIQFNTVEDAVYVGMKNDVSFIICNEMSLWEHQSSFNPNMPMRFFIYSCKLYEKYTETSDYFKYSSRLQPLPKPNCLCFYNGTEEQPERLEMKLSEAFGGEADIEVKVHMLNINYGKNRELMENCQPLREYAWLVDGVREHQRVLQDLEAAVDAAINEMPDSFAIKKFLISNQAEVKGMFLAAYDEEKDRVKALKEQERLIREAREEAKQEAESQANERVAEDLLLEKLPLELIKKVSRLPEERIRQIAQRLGVTVM